MIEGSVIFLLIMNFWLLIRTQKLRSAIIGLSEMHYQTNIVLLRLCDKAK